MVYGDKFHREQKRDVQIEDFQEKEMYCKQIFLNNPNDRDNLVNLAWIYVRWNNSLLKKIPLSSDDLLLFKQNLMKLLSIPNIKPSKVYSSALSLACKLKKTDQSSINILNFLNYWGLENFNADDWIQAKLKTSRSVSFSPLVVQTAILVGMEVLEDRKQHSKIPFDRLNQSICLIEDVIRRSKQLSRKSLCQLMNLKSELLIAAGLDAEALDTKKQLLQKTPELTESWSDVGHLLITLKRPELALGCFLYLSSFLSKSVIYRLAIVKILLSNQMYLEAKRELITISKLIEDNNLQQPVELKKIIDQPWYEKTSESSDENEVWYKDRLNTTLNWLFPELDWQIAIMDEIFIDTSGTKKFAINIQDLRVVERVSRFPNLARKTIGSKIQVKVVKSHLQNWQIIAWKDELGKLNTN